MGRAGIETKWVGCAVGRGDRGDERVADGLQSSQLRGSEPIRCGGRCVWGNIDMLRRRHRCLRLRSHKRNAQQACLHWLPWAVGRFYMLWALYTLLTPNGRGVPNPRPPSLGGKGPWGERGGRCCGRNRGRRVGAGRLPESWPNILPILLPEYLPLLPG